MYLCLGDVWVGKNPCLTFQCYNNQVDTIVEDCPEIKSCAQVNYPESSLIIFVKPTSVILPEMVDQK